MSFLSPWNHSYPPIGSVTAKKGNTPRQPIQFGYDFSETNEQIASLKGNYDTLEIELASSHRDPPEAAGLLIDLQYLPDAVNGISVLNNSEGTLLPAVRFKPAPGLSHLMKVGLRRVTVPTVDTLLQSASLAVFIVSACNILDRRLGSEIWTDKLSLLRISATDIGTIPEGIEKAKNMEILAMIQSGISEIPAGVSDLRSLSSVGFGGNELASLPEMPTGLRIGDFTNNRLRELPDWVYDSSCCVNIYGNPIDPGSEAAELTAKELDEASLVNKPGMLDFSYNHIRYLPPWMPNSRLARVYTGEAYSISDSGEDRTLRVSVSSGFHAR